MPMPKGKKVGKYVTLSDRPSMQFRRIAQVMTKRGDKMNHATARGALIKGMEKIAAVVLTDVKGYVDPVDVNRMVRSEFFQSYVGEVLDEDEAMKRWGP